MKDFGTILIVGGVILAAYAIFIIDTSVAVD